MQNAAVRCRLSRGDVGGRPGRVVPACPPLLPADGKREFWPESRPSTAVRLARVITTQQWIKFFVFEAISHLVVGNSIKIKACAPVIGWEALAICCVGVHSRFWMGPATYVALNASRKFASRPTSNIQARCGSFTPSTLFIYTPPRLVSSLGTIALRSACEP